jgi:hypothetical protein
MRFYQASHLSRVLQTALYVSMMMMVVWVLLFFRHRHTYVAFFVLLLAAAQLHSLWNRFWEITPDENLLSRAYGFRQTFPAASVRYAGPARGTVDFPVSKNDIELVIEGIPRKRYVRVADRREFIDELSRLSPRAEIIRF